jgi:amidophosphoribosyltransferase
MKLVPIDTLINNKKLLFVDDSIVRGTQMRGTVDFLYSCGAKELHIRTACPPILFGCKYLHFSRTTSESELLTRQVIKSLNCADSEKYIAQYADYGEKRYKDMVDAMRKHLGLTTLEFHALDSLLASISLDKSKLCTYCWNGAE